VGRGLSRGEGRSEEIGGGCGRGRRERFGKGKWSLLEEREERGSEDVERLTLRVGFGAEIRGDLG